MRVVTITKENFEAEVVGAKVPVVIDFWASWCGPCQMQSPVVDAVAESMGDQVKVCKVNVDEQPQLALNYQIVSIPTLVFMNFLTRSRIQRIIKGSCRATVFFYFPI